MSRKAAYMHRDRTRYQTSGLLQWFILCMMMYPEVQTKAQAEIDKVIGGERLPRIEDKEALPYVFAVMKEVFRWHPVVPLSA